jgi:hypothetical protein
MSINACKRAYMIVRKRIWIIQCIHKMATCTETCCHAHAQGAHTSTPTQAGQSPKCPPLIPCPRMSRAARVRPSGPPSNKETSVVRGVYTVGRVAHRRVSRRPASQPLPPITFQTCAMLHTPQQLKAQNAVLEVQIRKDAELREKQVPDHQKVDSHELKDKDRGGGANNSGVIEGRESPAVRVASPYCVNGVSYAASPQNANGVAYAASPHNTHMNQSPGAKRMCEGNRLQLPYSIRIYLFTCTLIVSFSGPFYMYSIYVLLCTIML